MAPKEGSRAETKKGSTTNASRLARTLGNPWRARILGELTLRPMSLSQFIEEVGGEKSTISRHFRQLAEWGYIEVAEERSGGRRGGVERIYRSIQRDHLDAETWPMLSLREREERSGNMIAFYLRRITEAVEAGTFDAEVDRHFSWDALTLDRAAWELLGERLDEVLTSLPEVQAEAAQRMKESGEKPIPATIGLAAFRSPTSGERRALRTRKATKP